MGKTQLAIARQRQAHGAAVPAARRIAALQPDGDIPVPQHIGSGLAVVQAGEIHGLDQARNDVIQALAVGLLRVLRAGAAGLQVRRVELLHRLPQAGEHAVAFQGEGAAHVRAQLHGQLARHSSQGCRDLRLQQASQVHRRGPTTHDALHLLEGHGEVILQQHEDAVLEAVGDLQPVLGGEILPVPGEGADPVGRGEGRGPVLIHQQAEGRAGVPLLLRVGHAPQEHADHLVGAGQVLRRVGRSRDAAAARQAQGQKQRQDQDAGQSLFHGSVPLLYVLSIQYNGPAAFCQRPSRKAEGAVKKARFFTAPVRALFTSQ